MVRRLIATCRDCGHRSEANEHVFRCELCGQTKDVPRDNYDRYFLRYLLSRADSANPRFQTFHPPYTARESMTEEEFVAAAEAVVGTCECGGQFRFYAAARCPTCRSTNIAECETLAMDD
jgi:Zn finger protein HypA/HybF involved in hydrogenase expression